MNARQATLNFVFLVGFTLIATPALALDVYQWTDDDGVIHFSQWAPDEGAGQVETVTLEGEGETDNGIGVSEQDDPEAYRAHREGMDQLWADLESRWESGRQQAEAPEPQVVYVREEGYPGYPYLYPGDALRPPFRPDRPRPPRPERPIEPPPASFPYKRP